MSRKSTKVMMLLGIILLAAAAGLYGFRMISEHNNAELSEKVMSQMQEMIPQYDEDDPAATGLGEDPLPAIEIEGISLVGYLEIASTDQKIPVADSSYDGAWPVFHKSGSPVRGKFVIGGSEKKGGLGSLGDIEPGDTVRFTDVNGVRYTYRITGLGSVRQINGLDHDLILYCGISRNTFLAAYGTMQ